MQVWGSALMCAALSIAMPLISHGSIEAGESLGIFLVAFLSSLALKLLTPVIETAQAAALRLGAKPGTWPFRLISSAFIAALMGTAMSLIMTLWGIRDEADALGIFIASWLSMYAWVLVIVYAMLHVCMITGDRIVKPRFQPNVTAPSETDAANE